MPDEKDCWVLTFTESGIIRRRDITLKQQLRDDAYKELDPERWASAARRLGLDAKLLARFGSTGPLWGMRKRLGMEPDDPVLVYLGAPHQKMIARATLASKWVEWSDDDQQLRRFVLGQEAVGPGAKGYEGGVCLKEVRTWNNPEALPEWTEENGRPPNNAQFSTPTVSAADARRIIKKADEVEAEGDTQRPLGPDQHRAELARRNAMWDELVRRADPLAVEPSVLHELRIYGGAGGIWVDKSMTRSISDSAAGVAVAVLHTGRHYPDDVSETALLYHFPATDRPPARDRAEVDAAKECGRLRLPIFVVLPSGLRRTLRAVRRGWIEDWDDESQQFLISFEPDAAADFTMPSGLPEEEPFSAFEDRGDRTAPSRVRANQPRFRMRVLKRYGPRCALCDVEALELLKAAHLVPAEKGGTDDPRNGLVLCGNHHDALDRKLITIEPESLRIQCVREYDATGLGIARNDLHHLRAKPHPDALRWRWGT